MAGTAGILAWNGAMTQSRTFKICSYQDCERPVQSWYELCLEHYRFRQMGAIDQCPHCGIYKDADYPQCRACYRSPARDTSTQRGIKYEPERDPQWEAADEKGDVFFVYILKLDGGKFYAGHTRDLRERMSEHRDGKTESTAGKNPRLVFFDKVDTRDRATELEAHFKELIDKNEREVRRHINAFQDLINLVAKEESSQSNDSGRTVRQGYSGYGRRR